MKAFPTHKEEGMELRDYFAARVMQAFMQNSAALIAKHNSGEVHVYDDYSFDHAIFCGVNSEIELHDSERGIKYTWAQYYAEEAYAVADAMMKARVQE